MTALDQADRVARYVEGALDRACADIAAATVHGRNAELNRSAYSSGRLVAGGMLSEEKARAALLGASIAAKLPEREACTTIRSAFGASARRPRTLDDLEVRPKAQAAPKPRPAEPAPAEKPRPPAAEVAAIWDASHRLSLSTETAWPALEAARSFLERRGLRPEDVGLLDVARCLPPSSSRTWPEWWPAWWAGTWSLVVRAFEPDGRIASLHARAVTAGADPKTRWPSERGAKGLLFADERGAAMLRGEPIAWLHGVLIVEGLTDLLRAAVWAAKAEARAQRGIAVLGIAAGSSPALGRVRWPQGVAVRVATDADKAGDDYATKVRAAIPRQVEVTRLAWSEVRA